MLKDAICEKHAKKTSTFHVSFLTLVEIQDRYKLSAVKLLLPSLGEGDYLISLLVFWINRFDLIYQSKVFEIADSGSSHRQYLLWCAVHVGEHFSHFCPCWFKARQDWLTHRNRNTKKGKAGCWQARLTDCVLGKAVTCQLEKVRGRWSKKGDLKLVML